MQNKSIHHPLWLWTSINFCLFLVFFPFLVYFCQFLVSIFMYFETMSWSVLHLVITALAMPLYWDSFLVNILFYPQLCLSFLILFYELKSYLVWELIFLYQVSFSFYLSDMCFSHLFTFCQALARSLKRKKIILPIWEFCLSADKLNLFTLIMIIAIPAFI